MDRSPLTAFQLSNHRVPDAALLAASSPAELPAFELPAFESLNLDLPAGPIAIVEDDTWVLKSLERLVRSAGLKVETFVSAEDFLRHGHNSGMVCLVLDIGLPGMSGLDLQRYLADESYRVPIIFVSAHSDTEIRNHALAQGAIAFLNKPLDDQAFLDAVSAVVK